MNCPICRRETIVLAKDGPNRRRQCTGCGNRFTTVEKLKEEDRRQQEAIEAVREAAGKLPA